MPGSPPWPNPATEGTPGDAAGSTPGDAAGSASGATAGPPPADIAAVAAMAGAALRDAGVPVGPERCQRFARAITLMHPRPPADRPARGPAGGSAPGLAAGELRACGLATLVSGPEQIEVLDRVFAALFRSPPGARYPAGPTGLPGGASQPGQHQPGQDPQGQHQPDGQPQQGPGPPEHHQGGWQPPGTAGPQRPDAQAAPRPGRPRPVAHRPDPAGTPSAEGELRAVASAAERLGSRDFAELSPGELGELEALMRRFALTTPLRRTRRRRRAPAGDRADLRATLRQARRTHGEPVKLARTAARVRPRRLVVLCDISGSMEPYARALLQLLYCVTRAGGAGASRTEVFTFATRLTRITPELAADSFRTVLHRAGTAAPDWSGGTRIGAALKEFNDSYGCHGMARGAVVLIISDGWETGDAARLGAQMARLSRVAHRVVWANPRTKSPRYRPEVSGMAAAWPYCDAVVSAHSLDALDDLIAALAGRTGS